MGNVIISHLAYADDMVLIAPTPKALNKLLIICDKYASLADIVFNTEKTLCMIFWPKKFPYKYYPALKLQGDLLNWCT